MTAASARRLRAFRRLEHDHEYRQRLLAAPLSGLERSMVEMWNGEALDRIGDNLKPPVQRRLVEDETR